MARKTMIKYSHEEDKKMKRGKCGKWNIAVESEVQLSVFQWIVFHCLLAPDLSNSQ